MTQKNNTSLTPRQQQVLDIIKGKIRNKGYPPTRVEIAKALGFRSANAAEDHLKALARKGVIQLIPGTSRGIRLLEAEQPPEATHGADTTAQQNPELVSLAVIGRVAAGSPVLATEHVEAELEISPHLFKQIPDYLLRVRGLSMRDAGILEGDLLAVKKTPEAHDGQIVVARIGDEVTVKRLLRQPIGNAIILLAENPNYENIVVTAVDDFQIEGVAVGLIRQ